MRGWVRTVALAAYYPLTSVALWVFGYHTNESLVIASGAVVCIGLLVGCGLHAWDERHLHPPPAGQGSGDE